jgi:hypothetical protein
MPVYNNLKAIRRLTNSSLTSIIDITNLNFKSLSDANLEFLTNIQYDETTNSFVVYKGTFDFVNITDTLSLTLDGIPTFTIDSLGRAEGQELLVKVAETKRLRFTDFNDWPDVGVPGEVIYTGIQNQRPEFGEDFIGYLQTRGWVSLTDGAGAGYITLTMLESSPPVPPCPGPNQGTLWVAAPGYQTAYLPSTQTLYYTDENCDTYDLVTDFIWEKVGNDGKFKLPGKVIIGDSANPRQFKYVDGTQSAGYVLTCDAFGNASWQPGFGGGSGGSCSFIAVQGFNANVPTPITHNLGTTNIVVQTIDIATNELIEGYIDNYQANSVEITFTQTLQVKVIILAACSGGGVGAINVKQEGVGVVTPATTVNFTGPGVIVTNPGSAQADIAIGTKNKIRPADVITVSPDYQYMVYGNLYVEGIVNNYGEIVIINGTPIVLPGGQINNIWLGLIKVVNLATGDSMKAVVQSFTATANVPLTITHNLNSTDFTYNVRDNLTLVDVDIVIIDANTVQLTSLINITAGSIVFQSKI